MSADVWIQSFELFVFYSRMVRTEDTLEAQVFQKNLMAEWTEGQQRSL